MIISASLKYLFSFLLIINSWGFCSRTTIKTYHVFESFGTETQELKNSIIMNYNSEGLLLDSAIYSHTIPLSKKYIVSYGGILLFLGDILKGYEYITKGEGVIKFTPSYYKVI